MSGSLTPQNGRPAVEGDKPCSCGLPAVVVYVTEMFGDVSSCGHA